MTLFLASVRDTHEAELAIAQGADIVDLKEPGQGALGALPYRMAREVFDAIHGRVPVSVTIGDISLHSKLLKPAIEQAAALRPAFIKIGLFGSLSAESPALFASYVSRGVTLVAVVFADMVNSEDDQAKLGVILADLQGSGFSGVMVDTADKSGPSLISQWGEKFCGHFLRKTRQQGLFAGLAGGLAFKDVAPLLALKPDVLGFRSALCADGREGRLDPICVQTVRQAIPRNGATRLGVSATLSQS